MEKVVLITGASSGIGKETALILAGKGFRVYGAARRVERMEELKKAGVNLLEMDVTDDASMIKGVQEIITKESRIDVLVNNAGYGSFGALEDVPSSEAKYQFEVNLFGMARLIQLVLPYMRSRKCGRIVNISSMAGKFGEPHGSWYHASKFAVEGLSDCLRMEVRQFGINVVLIEPGAIKTEWSVIAGDNLNKRSGDSAYKESAGMHLNLLKAVYKRGSEPIVIARTISKAVMSKNPRARYSAGAGAKLIIFARKMLPDRIFDAIVMMALKQKSM